MLYAKGISTLPRLTEEIQEAQCMTYAMNQN
jgi:hypothetical protein